MIAEPALPSTSSTVGKVRVVTALAVLSCAAASFVIRSYYIHDRVFHGGQVHFQEADPWYHVRAIEHLVRNFPHRLQHDPFALHPGGQYVPIGPLFDLLTAAAALLVGWGRPTSEQIFEVCAWMPPILGSLVVFPVYFIGQHLRDRVCGIIAAALVAVLPGLFLHRSLLGFTDHHVAEVLFSTLAFWAFIATVATGRSSEVDGPSRHGLIVRTGLCGLFLGAYLLTWIGGALLIVIICVALSLQVISDQCRSRNGPRPAVIAAGALAVTLAIVWPYRCHWPYEFHAAAVLGGLIYFTMTAALAWRASVKSWSNARFAGAVLIIAVAGLAALGGFAPRIAAGAINAFRYFISGSAGEFVTEASPLFFRDGKFAWSPAYEMFSTTLLIGALGLIAVCYAAVRHGRPAAIITAVWSLAMLAATLRQQRFAYYLAVNGAVASGYFWSVVADHGGRLASAWRWPKTAGQLAATAVIATVGLYPCLGPAARLARDHNGPHPDWRMALEWLRAASPEPFGDSDAYYSDLAANDSPTATRGFGVLCWWDAGYWVTAMARRSPTANPTQAGARETAGFLVAQTEEQGALAMERLQARYAVLDGTLPVWRAGANDALVGKFGAIIRWTGGKELDYYEPYLYPMGGDEYQPLVLYYPAFYRSMLSRLYLYGGREYVPQGTTWLVRYTEVPYRAGEFVKRIDETLQFPTYEQAAEFLRAQPGDWRMVGLAFGESCVPLEPIERFRLIYKSPTIVGEAAGQSISRVEIFEYSGNPKHAGDPP